MRLGTNRRQGLRQLIIIINYSGPQKHARFLKSHSVATSITCDVFSALANNWRGHDGVTRIPTIHAKGTPAIFHALVYGPFPRILLNAFTALPFAWRTMALCATMAHASDLAYTWRKPTWSTPNRSDTSAKTKVETGSSAGIGRPDSAFHGV